MKINLRVFLMLTLCAFALTSQVVAQNNRNPNKRTGDRFRLHVGEMAPNFVLKSLDGSQETDLSSFRGKKPVILFFGSYT